MRLNALFRLAFATDPPHGLTSPHITNSQAHSSKGTPSPHKEAPTDCRQTVSGTLSLPSRGAFHLSLTVLVRYRSSGSIQAYQVVLADSHEIPRAPCYSGTLHRRTRRFTYGTHTHYGRPFKTVRLHHAKPTPSNGTTKETPQHQPCNARQLSHTTGLANIRFRSPLLTESLLFSLPAGTEMFHFPAFPLQALSIQTGVTGTKPGRVPPFGDPRIKARLPAPRGLSQIATSFFGSRCQGIHRLPFET
jgi:hypothetical protein